MTLFHTYLKQCRLAKGLSIDDVSKALDISRSLLYQYEGNKVFPNGKNLIKLARYFHISLDKLFGIASHPLETTPIYNQLGHSIFIQDFPTPKNSAYYLLDKQHILLVEYKKHYRSGQMVLAYFKDKLNIFQITNHENQFYLLDKKSKLYPFNDKNIQILGIIIQSIYIYPQD